MRKKAQVKSFKGLFLFYDGVVILMLPWKPKEGEEISYAC